MPVKPCIDKQVGGEPTGHACADKVPIPSRLMKPAHYPALAPRSPASVP